jgi:hypothetical protein
MISEPQLISEYQPLPIKLLKPKGLHLFLVQPRPFVCDYLFFLLCSSIHAAMNRNATKKTTKHVPKSILFLLELFTILHYPLGLLGDALL